MIGEYMNIPFINDMYEEKNICVNEFSSEFQSLIDTYIVSDNIVICVCGNKHIDKRRANQLYYNRI